MPVPAKPSHPAGDESSGSLTELQLQELWKKYGPAVTVACGIALAIIVGKAGWDYIVAQRELAVQQDYAAAATPEEMQAFATAHPGDPLAGIAELRLGDQAYAGGRIADALDAYARATALLKTGPLAARAQLGLAVAKIESGLTTDGETGLRQLLDDPSQSKETRAEAGYQLASSEAASGRAEEVRQVAAQVAQIEPDGPWAARAFALEVRPAAPAAPAAPSAAGPSIQLPGASR